MTSASEQTSFGIGSKPRTEVLSVRIRLRRKVRCSRFRRSSMCSVLGWLACLWEGLFLSRKFILKGIHLLFWSAIRCKTNPSFFSRYGDGFLVGVRSGSDKDTVARFNYLFFHRPSQAETRTDSIGATVRVRGARAPMLSPDILLCFMPWSV